MQFNDYDIELINDSSGMMRALTHPLRITMLNYILENQPVKVADIYSDLQLDQSITSQHLRILRDSGMVQTERDGKFVLYKADPHHINRIVKAIHAFDKLTLARRRKKS